MSTPDPQPTPPSLEGWPRAKRPLRIALMGWARLSMQGAQGSGYNLSASELAAGLALMGHRVFYLASGRRYDPWPSIRIGFTEHWRGVACFDLFNSPNISPAFYNFRNMRAELDTPAQNALILTWLREHQIDVAHIHSLEGFPLSLIAAIKSIGVRVVVTPHNYWYVCPQVDLMRGESKLCMDYQGGKSCETCIRAPDPRRARLKRRLGHPLIDLLGHGVTGWGRRISKEVKDRINELRGRLPLETPNDRTPIPEWADGLTPRDTDDLVRHGILERRALPGRKSISPLDADTNEQFLRADHHLVVLNNYGKRRSAGVEALNTADAVTPPSAFMGDVYLKMGLQPSKLRVVRLGQPHFDQIHRRAKRSPYYTQTPWDARTATRPLRLAYFGVMRPSKGIDVLAAAIPRLPRDVRQRCHFLIHASGNDWPLRKPLSEFPEVSWWGGYDLLQLVNAGGEYDVGIVPHVWFENSPLVLLEHLHAGKFTISSRLGGPVEWIHEGENGLLIRPGDPDAIAAAITRLVTGDVTLPSAQKVHERSTLLRSWKDHVAELDGLYASLTTHP